jgi:S1-C subfamily serine protease
VTLELRVVSGARAGATERFDTPVVTVGRHPTSDLRFGLQDDLDVSARHAELRRVDGVWSVHDQGSTNGTFVNGERATSAWPIAPGDRIAFGAHGPVVEVVGLRAGTDVRIAAAVRKETASLRRGMVIGAVVLVALAATGGFVWRQQALARERALQTQPAQPATAVPRELPRSSGGIDLARIHDRNDAAVAMVASDFDGAFLAGTAFGVDTNGVLVTNRHLVHTAAGRRARRLRVIYANTTDWLPAHVVRESATDDLALIQLDAPGRHPTVDAVGDASDTTHVGAPIATIGYPHTIETPMEGQGLHVTARTTMTAGTVSKRLADVLQLDSYAGQGSSGSPVLDSAGRVIGVVFGGAPGSAGRIVYAVPGARLTAFLKAEPLRRR